MYPGNEIDEMFHVKHFRPAFAGERFHPLPAVGSRPSSLSLSVSLRASVSELEKAE